MFVFFLSTGGVMLRGALELLPVTVSAAVGAAWARAPVGRVLRRLAGLWVMIVFVTAMQVVFSGNALAGLLAGCAVLERLVILMLGGAVLAAYPGHVLVQGMLQLGLPYPMAFMVSAGLRFVPQFTGSFKDSLIAMQLRGVDFKQLGLRVKLKLYTWLLMPTIAMGISRAKKMAMAMELRGFGAYDRRSNYAPLRMRWRDWLALAGVLVLGGGLVTGEIVWRICS